MTPSIQLIIGLGNPGNEYHHTRHNAGADFINTLAKQHQTNLSANSKFFGLSGKANIQGHNIHLLIPTTFMNLSGKAVAAIAQFYKIAPQAILIAHDELDIPPGQARLKIGGGHGGHNGLKSIISHLGNNNTFARLRIGIGHPGNAKLVSHYVLKKAPENEYNATKESIFRACHIIPTVLDGQWNHAMKTLHTQ